MLRLYSCNHTSPGFEPEVLNSMGEMKNLINGLRRKHSALSLRSVASFAPSVKTKDAMKQLCRDLYRVGITADIIRDRKDQAVAAFRHPNTSSGVNQEVPHTESSVTQSQELLEGRRKGKGRGPALGIDSTSFRGLTGPMLRLAAAMCLKGPFLGEATPLDTGISNGHTDVVRQLLEKGESIEARRSYNGATLLDTAASNGHVDVVRLLLEKGANIDTRSDDGATPLTSAAYNDQIDVVKLLLENGANIEAMRDDTGSTPLDIAAYNRHIDVARMLLEKGANIETMSSNHGSTLLDSAAYNGHTDMVRLLLENGANIEAMRSDDGATSLNVAAHSGHIDVVRLLLENGANIEAIRSSNGSTALYNASWRGHVGIVSLLLGKGANIESTRADNGKTALHEAALYLQTEVVRLLLEKGANIYAVTKNTRTALHLVFYGSTPDFGLRDPEQVIPTITVLLAHGANILQKDDSGRTPLNLAEKRGYLEVKRLFLQHIKEHTSDRHKSPG